jgi:small subunit ribosomal protein S18
MTAKVKKGARPRRRSSRNQARKRIDINSEAIDFRNTELLKKFVTEKGKILPRRITGMPAKLHRKLTNQIKRARNVLLLK